MWRRFPPPARHSHVNLQRLNLRLFIRLQHTSVLFLVFWFVSKCTEHFVVTGSVCKLFEEQINNQENGMLTKEATSWTVVATSSAL